MKLYTKKLLYSIANIIEIIIAFIIVASIIISAFGLVFDIGYTFVLEKGVDFNDVLSKAFNLVIGVEFIKMLCKHTTATVIEVLLFAMAKQIIVVHSNTFNNMIGVVAIAILFFIQRYLFCNFDESDKSVCSDYEKASKKL